MFLKPPVHSGVDTSGRMGVMVLVSEEVLVATFTQGSLDCSNTCSTLLYI